MVLDGVTNLGGSATTIYNPSEEMRNAALNSRENILQLRDDYEPVFSCEAGEIVEMGSAGLFVKGFKMSEKPDFCLFTYNLPMTEISPDRNMVDTAKAREWMDKIISLCDNYKVIKTIVQKASGNPAPYAEFYDFEPTDTQKDLWKKAFFDVYGQNAVIITPDSVFEAAEAVHRGYVPIAVNASIYSLLKRCGVPGVSMTDFSKIEEIPIDLLSEDERRILEISIRHVDSTFNLNRFPIAVFERAYDVAGRMVSSLGFYDSKNEVVWLSRSILSGLPETMMVYNHERGHQRTGASDPEDPFRMHFEVQVTQFLLTTLGMDATRLPQYEPIREKLLRDLDNARFEVQKLKGEIERGDALKKAQRDKKDLQERVVELERKLAKKNNPSRGFFRNLFGKRAVH